MRKRTIWYVCLAVILAFGATAILNAAGGEKDKKVDKAPSGVSVKPLLKPGKAPQAAQVDPSAVQKAHAYELYERMMNGGELSPAEKDLVYSLVGNPVRDNGNSLDNTGGPDASGYRYKDSVTPDTAIYTWIELRGDVVGVTWINAWASYDDGMATNYAPIGFTFPYYGGNYTQFKPSSNGQIEFGTTTSPYSYTSCLSAVTTWGPAVMPYMYDLHLQRGGDATGNNVVGYKNFGNYTVMEYDSIGYYNTTYAGSSLKFEVILYNDGKIKVQYNNMVLAGGAPMATVGIVSGTTTANNFLQYRCYNQANTVMPISNGLAIWYYQAPGLLHDFACSAITGPTSPQFVNASATVIATFTNAGQTTELSPVYYQFNNGAIVGPENTASLAQFGTENHTFTTPLTMPATPGIYPLKVWSALATDLDRTNDTARVNITVRSCYNVDLGSGFVSVTGQTTCGMGNTYMNTCLGLYDGGEDMTYKWTCVTEGDYLFRMDSHGTTYPGMLLSNHCPPDSQCVRDTVNTTAVVLTFCQHLLPGVYYIMIDTWPAPPCIPNFDFSIGDCGTGRCCYGDPTNPSCADNSNSACTALNGQWTMGVTCAGIPCPPRPANDNCGWVTPVTLPATFTGNVNNATHDCNLTTTGDGEVWHAFTLAQCSNVTLDFCNSNANWASFATTLVAGCPCTSLIYSTSSEYTTCANGNITIHWNLLGAGTYYYPVYWYPTSGDSGAYSINVSAVPCPPPPPNDLCANAIALNGPMTAVPWDNSAAVVTAENTYCTMYHDIWYCWTTLCETDVNVTTCGSSFDTKLAVFNTDANCTCPTGTGIACNDDSTCIGFSLNSALSFHALTGKYMIEVGSFSSSGGGGGVLTINTAVQCSCDSAQHVTVYMDPNNAGHTWLHFDAPTVLGRYQIYTTTVKNNDGDPRNSDANFALAGTVIASATGAQVWPDTSATGVYKNYVVVHDCATLGRCCYGDVMNPSCTANSRTNCDVLQGLWTANLDCNTPCPIPHIARCCYNSGANCVDNAHFQCDALGGRWDSLLTCETFPCPTVPPNRTCGTAIVLPGPGTYTGDNTLADSVAGSPAQCVGGNWFMLWYTYTPATSGAVTVNTCTLPGFDTVVDALTGTCGGTMVSVGCNDDGCIPESTFGFTAVGGTTFYIRVASYFNTASPSYRGAFNLTIVGP